MRLMAQARNPYFPMVVMGSRFTLRVPRNDKRLRHAGAQDVVQVHDADRPVGVGHDQRRDLR
jgi:hypothetical protein